jgi:ubiquinone biosynthesis protein
MGTTGLTQEPTFEEYVERRPRGLVGRYFQTVAQLSGLFYGWAYWHVQEQRAQGNPGGLIVLGLRFYLFLGWLFVDRSLVKRPFAVQFRIRFERMGPTYIKLGQILSLREDLLPKSLTDELKNLLSELPAVPFDRFRALVEADLGRPIEVMFAWVAPTPLGSASLAQSHRARLHNGDEVVLKVLKPGVRETIKTDTQLLRLLGRFLQFFLARFQPKQLIDEFARYTLREVDLRNEADNAEIFAANFSEQPDIRFPRIYRSFSNHDVLCMEFFAGRQPSVQAAATLTQAERSRVLDLGVGAIIDMIFRDGFFHADLHPGNLIMLGDGAVGFIDLGMVGRFDSDTKNRMMYYYYSLGAGDAPGAARQLAALAIAGKGSDIDGFRQAVEELSTRWLRTPTFSEFSVGQLVLQSVALAGKYRIRYPGEIILMVKALITVEGVGNLLEPGINVTQVSARHIRRILIHQFNVVNIVKDSLLALPELLDLLQRSPLVLNQGLRYMESSLKNKQEGALADSVGAIFGVGLLLSAAIMAVGGIHWIVWGGLIVAAFVVVGVERIRR